MFSTPIENNKRRNETAIQIYRAFEQLKQSLVNGIDPTQTIFKNLHQIFCRLTDRNFYTQEDVVDLFEIILANYLDLIDNDQLLDLIEHRYAYINNVIFISLFDSIVSKNISEFMNRIAIDACQKRYHRLLDQLQSSQRLLSYLTSVQSSSTFCRSILFLIFRVLNQMNVKLLDIELRKYQNSLFVPLLAFLDEHFRTNEHPESNKLLEEILLFIRAITIETLTIPIFINAKYPQACVRWLSRSSLHPVEYAYILHILGNIALHEEGAILLNEHQCNESLIEFQSDRLDTHIAFLIDEEWYEELQLSSLALTITLVDPSELNLESIKWSIAQYLSPRLSNSLQSKTYQHSTVYMPQLTIVLIKLCINDDIIHSIFKEDNATLPIYVLRVSNFWLYRVTIKTADHSTVALDVLALIALANILWSLSFHELYRNILIKNNLEIQQLVSFQSSDVLANVLPNIYIPRHMSSLKRAIDGIQHNLDPPSPAQITVSSSKKCSIMISYAHMNIEFCRQLYHVLGAHSKLTLTVDFINSKYLWKEKMQMIEQSDIILFLISEDFLYSRSCRQELIYGVDTLKRPFIPVFIDRDFQPLGWLNQRIVKTKCIRVEQNDLARICDEILTLVRERFSIKINKSTGIEHWSHAEVKQWFSANKIPSELHEFYDFKNGNDLLAFAHAILPYPWTDEYNRITPKLEKIFQQKGLLSPYEYSKFFSALQRLNQSLT